MTTFRLTGACNQCGACCRSIAPGGVALTCEHLEVLDAIGTPAATRCRAYARRYDGMPVHLYDTTGCVVVGTTCAKGSVAELVQTISRIGQGCSYTVEVVA